jgi:type IV pilus assembly protein PilM
MSRHAQQSKWVKTEVSWAVHFREGRIVPVLVDDCDVYKIHLNLITIQHLDFRSSPTLAREKLVALFGGAATEPATTGPAPSPTTESTPPPGQPSPSRVGTKPSVRRPGDFDGENVVLPARSLAPVPSQGRRSSTLVTPSPVLPTSPPRGRRPGAIHAFFKRLFGRSATRAIWGVDIGEAALKALKLVPGENPDQVVAEAFDFIEYPKILSQPDADPDELVREALAIFTDRNEVKGCKVAIAVPVQSGLIKFIIMAPVEKQRIPDVVESEAKQQIPFALDEVVWAYHYQEIGVGGDEVNEEEFTMAEVGLFAMKRDQINRAILPFTVAGIEVDIVQMSPIALYNFISFDQIKGSGSKDSVVLLDIGADNTDLIITDGNRIWQRNVPIGGNHFTRALTKELKLTFAKAEHLKRNATKAPDPRAIFTAMRGVFDDFASEVDRSIGFYQSITRQAKIRKVIGLGNGFKLPGMQKYLQARLSVEVTRLEGFDQMVGDKVKSAPIFQDNLASFAVAYGLGIQGLDKGRLNTNLEPNKVGT